MADDFGMESLNFPTDAFAGVQPSGGASFQAPDFSRFGGGSDPFGGGGEGLPKFDFNADQIKASSSPVSLPETSTGPETGVAGWAGRMFGGQGDQQPTGQPGRSSGIMDDLGGGLKGFAQGILPTAQLGLSAFGIKNQLDAVGAAKKQAGQVGQMQQIQRESSQPLQQFGVQELGRASAGQIDPAQQAIIDQWAQAQKVKMRQFFASNGIQDSTMMVSAEADIDAKAAAMKGGNLQMMQQLGIQALSNAGGIAGQGAQTASREQTALDNLIAESNRALAALTGSVG